MTENINCDPELKAEFEAWEQASAEAWANFENSLPDEPYEIEILEGVYAYIKEKTDAVDSQ